MCGSVGWRVVIVFGLTAFALGIITQLLPKAEYLPSGNRNLIFGVVLPPPGYNTEKYVRLGESIETVLAPIGMPNPGPRKKPPWMGPVSAIFSTWRVDAACLWAVAQMTMPKSVT